MHMAFNFHIVFLLQWIELFETLALCAYFDSLFHIFHILNMEHGSK